MLASIPMIAPAPHQPQSSCWPTGVAFCLGGRLTQQGLHHVCLVSPAGDHVMDHLSVVGRKSVTHQQLTAPALATILGFHDSPPVPCCNAPRSRRPPRPVRRAPRPSPYAGRRLRFPSFPALLPQHTYRAPALSDVVAGTPPTDVELTVRGVSAGSTSRKLVRARCLPSPNGLLAHMHRTPAHTRYTPEHHLRCAGAPP